MFNYNYNKLVSVKRLYSYLTFDTSRIRLSLENETYEKRNKKEGLFFYYIIHYLFGCNYNKLSPKKTIIKTFLLF